MPTEPAAPPATPPAAAPDAPKVDPFVQELLDSINKVVTPDGNIGDAPPPAAPEPAAPGRKPVTMTVGEHLAEQDRISKANAAKPPGEPAPDPNAPAAPAPAAPPTPAPAPTPEPAPAATKLKKKDPMPPAAPAFTPAPPTPVAPPAPAPAPAPPAADPDAAFIAQLDADQQAELDTAAFAETKFPELKGKRAETLAYFKKVDEFAKSKPDATADELDQFISTNKPQWKPGQKRKVEQTFIIEQATRTATDAVRSELEPKLKQAEKRLQAQELAPTIDRAVNEFRDLLSSPEVLPDASMQSFPAEVGKRIAEVGYAKAAEEFHIEAPIFASTNHSAREWLRLTNGLVDFNPNDQTHKWLLEFVTNQGRIYAAKPESVQNGKRFMPLLDHLELMRSNPAEAANYYTFNDQNVLDMLALNANIAYNAQLTALEKSGFKREKKNSSPNPPTPAPAPIPTPTPAPTPTAASPRMRGTSLPGAAAPEKKASPNASMIDTLGGPGTAERLGL